MLKEVHPVIERLKEADRACQKELGGSLFFRSIKYLLGFLLLAFLLDVFLHLSSAQRLVLLAVWSGIILVVLGRFVFVSWIHHNQMQRIARLLESRDPALGSKLINLLQLDGQTSDTTLAPLTRQLAQQAVAGYARELTGVDFEPLTRTRRLRTEFTRAAWAGLAFMAILAAFFRVSTIEISRFFDPYGDHPPYSITQLDIFEPGPSGAQVIYNKSHLVKVNYIGHKPRDLFLTFYPPGQPNKTTTVPMFSSGEKGFHQQIEKIQSDLVVYAHTKDGGSYSQKRHLRVVLTPKLEKAFVKITPPAYTGLKPEEKPFQFQNLRALVGSSLQFRLQSNRPLRQGAIEFVNSDTAVEHLRMTNLGPQEVTASFLARESSRFRFSFVDTNGIPSQDLWEGSLTLTYDLPPEVRITNPANDCFVSIDFKLDALIEASDDYGLKQLRIHRATNQVFFPPIVVPFEGIVRDARHTLPFNFREMGVQPGDVVSFFVEAMDTAPESNLSRSQTVNLMVISEEAYNAFLRENSDISDIQAKYSELLDKFHDLVEEQKKLGEAIDALKQQIAKKDPTQKDIPEQELNKLLARQNEINQKLNKLASNMDQFVRKNPVYDIETELQKILAQKADTIRSSTSTNDSATKSIAQQSSQSSGSQRPAPNVLDDFKKASDEQLARLGDVERQSQNEIEQTLEDMSQMHELVKDFNEFEALYKVQKALAEQARAYNRAGQLSREDQLALKDLAATEHQVGEQLDQLAAKLREDAKNAEKLFPKASQSGRELADKMEEMRFANLARQATGSMLNGAGDKSFQLSDRLSGEMEKLFSECRSQGGQMASEMDSHLRLQKGMNPRQSFQQMQQSRKFGGGKSQGMAMGKGEGQGGSSGYAVSSEQSLSVLGSETLIEKSSAKAKPSQAGLGKGAVDPATGNPETEKPDVRKGLNPINRQSDVVTSESLVEEYRDIVDKYFKTITK